MRSELARRIVLAVLLGIGWGLICDALNISWIPWLIGLLALDFLISRIGRPARPRAPRRRRRVGPPMEWID